MALTDKSAIPLKVSDLRVVEGEPRFNDGRLALRLDLDRRWWRQLIQRHEAGALERGLGHLLYGTTYYKGGRGRPSRDWFLTIEQTIYFLAQTETKNTLDVIAEVAKVVGALRRGVAIPETPWTDALLAPDKPTIFRGDGNVVHVKHAEPLPPQRESEAEREWDVGDYMDADAPLPKLRKSLWEEEYEGCWYAVRLRSNGHAAFTLRMMPADSNAMQPHDMWKSLVYDDKDGPRVLLEIDQRVPLALLERVLTENTLLTPFINRTLNQLLNC